MFFLFVYVLKSNGGVVLCGNLHRFDTKHCPNKIPTNVWRIGISYGLWADRVSYVQPYAGRGAGSLGLSEPGAVRGSPG